MNKKIYKEYTEKSELLWLSEKEDKITRKFYRDLTRLTKTNISENEIKKLNFFELILSLIKWQR